MRVNSPTGLQQPGPSPSVVRTSLPLGVLLRLSMSGSLVLEVKPPCYAVRIDVVVSDPVGLLPWLSICSTGSVGFTGFV